jgi:hypothetical protein
MQQGYSYITALQRRDMQRPCRARKAYAINKSFEYRVVYSEKRGYTIKCKVVDYPFLICRWFLFRISKFPAHPDRSQILISQHMIFPHSGYGHVTPRASTTMIGEEVYFANSTS